MDRRPALRRVVTAMVKPYMWNMGSSSSPFFPIYQILKIFAFHEDDIKYKIL
jgi:hypothetical protein